MKAHGACFSPAALAAFGCLAFSAFAADNELTPAEKADGWRLLFDGKTLAGWLDFRSPGSPIAGWEIMDGTLRTVAGVRGSQLVTDRKFDDFEFEWEWRIAGGGNNGVKYFVTDARPGAPGHEYQILDDPKFANLPQDRLTAAFYEVLPAAADKPLRPAGEWNVSRIVVSGQRVEHWLNGRNVLTYELGSDAVKAGIARSKFRDEPGFGGKIAGPIMLTYHRDECWFRNLKIRELGAVASASMPAPRPNVLFIIFDDWGWQNAGVYGSTWVRTPTFDRLAREGVLFRNAFTSNPKCSPCRASILTGRNAWQTEEGNAGYPVRAIRTPEWLYVRNYAPERWPAGNLETDFPNCDDGPTKAWITEHRDKFFDRAFGLRPAEVLYRMGADAADPACLDNLAGDPRYAGTVRELRERMEAMLREEGDPRMFGYGEIFDTYPWYGNRAHAYGTWLRNFPPAAENWT